MQGNLIGRIYNHQFARKSTSYNLQMERSMSTAVEVCSEMSNLNEKCTSRNANKFLSIKIKQIPDFATVSFMIKRILLTVLWLMNSGIQSVTEELRT